MANLLAMMHLIPAIRIVFRFGTELTERDFQELTPEQYAAYHRNMEPTKERIFRMVLVEPTVLERSPERVLFELEIVTESQKNQLLEAVRFIKKSTSKLKSCKPSFEERLDYLRNFWPKEVTGKK